MQYAAKLLENPENLSKKDRIEGLLDEGNKRQFHRTMLLLYGHVKSTKKIGQILDYIGDNLSGEERNIDFRRLNRILWKDQGNYFNHNSNSGRATKNLHSLLEEADQISKGKGMVYSLSKFN